MMEPSRSNSNTQANNSYLGDDPLGILSEIINSEILWARDANGISLTMIDQPDIVTLLRMSPNARDLIWGALENLESIRVEEVKQYRELYVRLRLESIHMCLSYGDLPSQDINLLKRLRPYLEHLLEHHKSNSGNKGLLGRVQDFYATRNGGAAKEGSSYTRRILVEIFSDMDVGKAFHETIFGSTTKHVAFLWAMILLPLSLYTSSAYCFGSIVQESLMLALTLLQQCFGGRAALMEDKSVFDYLLRSEHFSKESKKLLEKLRLVSIGTDKMELDSTDRFQLLLLLREVPSFQSDELARQNVNRIPDDDTRVYRATDLFQKFCAQSANV